MSTVPRIQRALPRGGVTRPEAGIPVVALIRWHDGRQVPVPAVATAWTRDAVEITWEPVQDGGLRSDWIEAVDVRRSVVPEPGSKAGPKGGPAAGPTVGSTVEQGPAGIPAGPGEGSRPPRSRPGQGRPRW